MPVEFDLFDSAYNDVLAASGYVEFRKRLNSYNCQKCPRGKARNHIVIDRGNPESKLLIVSERPGDNEDTLGQAFVGRSGELLDKIMASIGLDTNRDLLIVNVVKCKAEIDRGPSAQEVEACFPYLRRQIELMRPKVVLLLGAVADGETHVRGFGRRISPISSLWCSTIPRFSCATPARKPSCGNM